MEYPAPRQEISPPARDSSKLLDLTSREDDLVFNTEARHGASKTFCAMPPGTAVAVRARECESADSGFSRLVYVARLSCGRKACTSLVLDKGKPVARPGRKAKGRRLSAGSLAAERVLPRVV